MNQCDRWLHDGQAVPAEFMLSLKAGADSDRPRFVSFACCAAHIPEAFDYLAARRATGDVIIIGREP